MQEDRGDELERRWKQLAASTNGSFAFDAEQPDEAQAVLERLDGLIAGFGALLRDTQDYGNDLKRDVRRRLAESALRERELEHSAGARLARTLLGSAAERMNAAEREAIARQSAELRRQAAEVKKTMRAREDEIAATLEQLRRQRQTVITVMEATAVCV